jgi:lipoic acid synthetase
VVNHNVETVPRLYPRVRRGSDYRRSLRVLKAIKELSPDTYTKSAIILGFGERKEEVMDVIRDLRGAEVDILTIGQYYQPSLRHHPVVKYYSCEEFEEFKNYALGIGFKFVASGPAVRSSYKALEAYLSGHLT